MERSPIHAAVLVLAMGCTGLHAGAIAGVSRSSNGTTRGFVDVPFGGTPLPDELDDEDRAWLVSYGIAWRFDVERGQFRNGADLWLAFDQFWGAAGYTAQLALGGALSPSGAGDRLSVRLHAGPQVELFRSDWRVIEYEPCPGGDRELRHADTRHVTTGALIGFELFSQSRANEGRSAGWAVSLAGAFRSMLEPTCGTPL